MHLGKIHLITFGLTLFLSSIFLKPDTMLSFSRQKPLKLAQLNGQYIEKPEKIIYDNKNLSLVPPKININSQNILGEETPSDKEKVIYVDLTNQRLYAFEGNNLIYNFLVSTGKWGRTPTGVFRIWIKLKYTTMSGGSKALGTYYYLPNVPYTMFFYNEDYPQHIGYGIHGTYWHDNFGHPMSHGCINMKTEEVEKVYYWANPNLNGKESIRADKNNPGTKIVIFGTASQE